MKNRPWNELNCVLVLYIDRNVFTNGQIPPYNLNFKYCLGVVWL